MQTATTVTATPSTFVSVLVAQNLIPDGWKVVSDTEFHSFLIRDLTLCTFKRVDLPMRSVTGKQLRHHALQAGYDFGLSDAKRILVGQNLLDPAYREYGILFPGTKLLAPDTTDVFFPSIQYSHRQNLWRLVYRTMLVKYPASHFRLISATPSR